MQFTIEEFTKRITEPYLVEMDGGDDKKLRKHRKGESGRKHYEHQCHGMVDQSEAVPDWDMDLQQQVL